MTTTASATTTVSAATTTKKVSSESPKTGDIGLAGVILAGTGAVAMAFALRKREE